MKTRAAAADPSRRTRKEIIWIRGNGTPSGLTSATRVKKDDSEAEEKGTFWRATMIEPRMRLRVARGMGKRETEAAIEVFRTLKRRR